MSTVYSWILDSGGTGRGAWQGGVIHEFMRWCRESGCFPSITMGASAGGYAAADVATGTEQTVMKGWTYWGAQTGRGRNRFRSHLRNSVYYVMEEQELSGVFRENSAQKLLIFTTRARRSDLKIFRFIDRLRFFLHSATRKLPRYLKYFPAAYIQDPVIFALNLPTELHSEYIRPLTRNNYHAVIETSCLVPVAMGSPLCASDLDMELFTGDHQAVFMDGGYTLKMPMRLMEEDQRFKRLAHWISADKTVIFCCDPEGWLWETSARLHRLNTLPSVSKAIDENRLLVIHPDHRVEAGFLCMDHAKTMRTFNRGREQAQRLLRADRIRRFFEI
jgi:hypothetical protein